MNVALSLILYPGFLSAGNQFILTKIVSLAVYDLMAEMLPPKTKVQIKWPNDIYVEGKKIAGILIENTLREHQIHSSVIGVGMNVNQLVFNTTSIATSLAEISGKEYPLKPIVERFCELMEARYLQLKANKRQELDAAYLERLLGRNEWRTYTDSEGSFEGMIQGIEVMEGKLLIEKRSGQKKTYGFKEIQFVW
jgi:BirA family biotin operon repressor/biotin-[acetyl-CoA-carboxylase] ligase